MSPTRWTWYTLFYLLFKGKVRMTDQPTSEPTSQPTDKMTRNTRYKKYQTEEKINVTETRTEKKKRKIRTKKRKEKRNKVNPYRWRAGKLMNGAWGSSFEIAASPKRGTINGAAQGEPKNEYMHYGPWHYGPWHYGPWHFGTERYGS